MSSRLPGAAVAVLLGLCCLPAAQAQMQTDQRPLATRGDVAVTGRDLEAKIADLPEIDRVLTLQSGDRLALMLDATLLTLQMAAKARDAGLDQDPLIQRQMELAAAEVLADHALRLELEATSMADRQDALEAYARERYLADRKSFDKAGSIQVKHILLTPERRTEAELLAEANAILERARAGEDFDKLVMDHSEDQSKRNNGGLIDITPDSNFFEGFVDAANNLTPMQPLSDLVRTPFGIHIIKLIGRTEGQQRTFEDVREGLMRSLERRFEEGRKQRVLSDLRAEKPTHDEAAIAAFLDELARRQQQLTETPAGGSN